MNPLRVPNPDPQDDSNSQYTSTVTCPQMPQPVMTPGPRGTQRVAAVWHTVVLTVLLLGISFAGADSQHKFATRHGRDILYGMTIVWEWLIVAFIAWGMRRFAHRTPGSGRMSLLDLAAGRWRSLQDVLADVALGVGFWIAALFILGLIGAAIGLAHPHQVAEAKQKLGFLVPHGPFEVALFLCLSATAGFCEEIIFRGYFQRQFGALTHSLFGGLILQALIFGAGHGYEGRARMVLIAIYGVLFGLLALARNSLRPGMLVHFLQDAVTGLALDRLLR